MDESKVQLLRRLVDYLQANGVEANLVGTDKIEILVHESRPFVITVADITGDTDDEEIPSGTEDDPFRGRLCDETGVLLD